MLYPLVMEPVLANKPWGGRRLARYGKTLPPDEPVGESWELADLDVGEFGTVSDARSRIANGPLTGRTLQSVIEQYGEELMDGVSLNQGRFPILIKLLDAHQHLSVQVHPTAQYVAQHPTVHLKTESWYVVEAEPGAHIYKGFAAGVTPEKVEARAGQPGFVDLLEQVPVIAGDIHHLPAGTVHALGAGVMVAEVQTPSDTTFRLYDWTTEYGRPARSLHLEQALACLDYTPPRPAEPYWIGGTTRSLVETSEYWVHEHLSERGALEFAATPGPRVVMVVDGALRVGTVDAPKGTTVLVPASVDVQIESDAPVVALEIGVM